LTPAPIVANFFKRQISQASNEASYFRTVSEIQKKHIFPLYTCNSSNRQAVSKISLMHITWPVFNAKNFVCCEQLRHLGVLRL